MLAQWAPSGIVNHFPKSIPSNASNLKFSAFLGAAKETSWLQLRMVLPAEEVVNILNTASTSSKGSYDGGFSLFGNHARGGLPGTSFRTADKAGEQFSSDYRVFTLGAEDRGDHWTHGTCYGVVVSKKRNEVIYYAEQW